MKLLEGKYNLFSSISPGCCELGVEYTEGVIYCEIWTAHEGLSMTKRSSFVTIGQVFLRIEASFRLISLSLRAIDKM